MNSEEKAINLLQSADIDKETGDVQWHTWYKGIGEDVKETFEVAIRHIQAWDKVKEEIRDRIIPDDEESKYNLFCKTHNKIHNEILEIIDKHLQEVEK